MTGGVRFGLCTEERELVEQIEMMEIVEHEEINKEGRENAWRPGTPI